MAFHNGVSREFVGEPGCGVGVEIPSDGICAVFLECIERINRVALGLTHLLTVLVKYKTEYDYVLVRCLVEKKGALSHKGIEPSSGLVNRFGNELSGELLLKEVLVLERIVMLSKRHCA